MPENTGPGQCRIEIPYHSGIGYCAHGMIPDGKHENCQKIVPFHNRYRDVSSSAITYCAGILFSDSPFYSSCFRYCTGVTP